MTQPYTYLIGWTHLDRWYYGVRFAKNCSPSDLWDSYFTSSKYVTLLREEHGEPDIIQVRRIFETAQDARNWEHKVLRRLKVIYQDRWINKACGKSIDPSIAAAAASKRMLTDNPMKIPEIARKVANKMRETNIARYRKMTPEERSNKFGHKGVNNPFYGKKHSEELQERITQKISGNYIITDPHGNVNQINNLHRYCKDHHLNRDILMKHMDKDPVPEPIYRTKSVARHNTTGYSIKRIS